MRTGSLVESYHVMGYSVWSCFTLVHASILSVLLISGCNTIDEKLGFSNVNIGHETSEPGVVKFVAVGDTGHGNDEQYRIGKAIAKKCAESGCDFVLLMGDNIYPDGVNSVDDVQFKNKFELPFAEIQIPFYVVLGNHDYGGNGKGFEINKSFYQVQYTDKSEKWVLPKHFYYFTKADVAFFAMDTNAQVYGVADEQERDLPKWIKGRETTWKIAYGHHPYKSNGPHGNAGNYDNVSNPPVGSGELLKDFAEDVWCGKVDLYLSGHDHSRQWLKEDCKGTVLAVSGAGSGTSSLSEKNPVLFQDNSLGFLYVRIEAKTLAAEFVDQQGNTDFVHTIRK